MSIDKGSFHQTVLEMKGKPKDVLVQNRYFKEVKHLAEIIAKSYRLVPIDDTIQDLLLYSITKRLHERISPEKSAFSYYWKSLSGHAWWIQKERKRKSVSMSFVSYENLYNDKGEGEEDVLRKLDFTLEEFQSQSSVENSLDSIEVVEVSKGKRGRPKTKQSGEKAAHWEYLFSILRKRKTMTEKALHQLLPLDKQKGLKSPGKSIEYYMRQISKREGAAISLSNNGVDNVYMLLGVE